MTMNKATRTAIEQHALAEYPRECCGLIIRENRKQLYVPCRNTAATPSEHFRLAPEDYAAAEDRGEVLAVVHSHPDHSAMPSDADRVACEASGIPWHIVEVRKGADDGVAVGELYSFVPAGYEAPLIGRPFHHGVLDCLTLIQDYYRREMGILLPQYEREDEWWNKGQNLYLDHYEAAGFYPVNDLRQGDLVLLQIRAPVPNHGAIYLADGMLRTEPGHHPAPGTILHHLYGHDSKRDVYGGYWAENTRMVLRHRAAHQN